MDAFNFMGFTPMPMTGGEPQPPVDSSRMTWTNSPDPQTQSRLVALPAEIKSMILKQVLVADQPISARAPIPGRVPYRYDSNGRARDFRGRFISTAAGPPLAIGHGLTPAILRTSQSLLASGRLEMYHGNVLQLDVQAGAYNGPRPSQETICSADQVHCQSCVIVTTLDDEIIQQRDHQGVWQYDANIQQIVNRFSHIRFSIRMGFDRNTYESVRYLMKYWARTPGFANKKVEVEVVSPTPNWVPLHSDVLQIFRLMRCEDFKFLDSPGGIDPIRYGIEREVKSKLPVMDLDQAFLDVQPLLQSLINHRAYAHDHVAERNLWQEMNKLYRFRTEYRYAEFERLYEAIDGMYQAMIARMQATQRNARSRFAAAQNVNTARAQELARTGKTLQDYRY